ncbi:MAG: uracil-DNA glycosylase [Alphaproteobacteria bacterium]|nr:uracil-DNA glycosylase [Alphaproteobacteria bacterium]
MPTNPNLSTDIEAYEALHWLMEIGASEAVEAEPTKPLEVSAQPLEMDVQEDGKAPTSSVNAETAPLSASLAQIISEARTAADAATTLEELYTAIRNFNGCTLKKTAQNTVIFEGIAQSRLMFIGEAPGADEDRQGVPFCGASGQLLDKALSFIGLNRKENFYITNTLFWRPPGNRTPTTEELEICKPFVEKHIALIKPHTLVLVGGTATKAVLNNNVGITRLRGQLFSYKNSYMDSEVPVHVIYHPSYLLRQPSAKKQAWADILQLKQHLKAIGHKLSA